MTESIFAEFDLSCQIERQIAADFLTENSDTIMVSQRQIDLVRKYGDIRCHLQENVGDIVARLAWAETLPAFERGQQIALAWMELASFVTPAEQEEIIDAIHSWMGVEDGSIAVDIVTEWDRELCVFVYHAEWNSDSTERYILSRTENMAWPHRADRLEFISRI